MARRAFVSGFLVSAACLSPLAVRAEEPSTQTAAAVAAPAPRPVEPAAAGTPRRIGGVKVELRGSYRLLLWNQTDLPLGLRDHGESAEKLGQTTFVEHRLRVGALLTRGNLEFDFEVDALNGLLNAKDGEILQSYPAPEGSVTRPDMADPLRNRSYGTSLNSFALRRAMLTYKSNIGNFAFGATSFSWAQGMLSNSGADEIDQELSDQRFGDRTVRLMYATKPLYYLSGGEIEEDITSVLGFDLLLQDETGSLVNAGKEFSGVRGVLRDRGLQVVGALKHARGGYSSGLFMTKRWLTFEDSYALDPSVTVPFATMLSVFVADFALDYTKKLTDTLTAYGAFEGAFVTGRTNFARNASCLGLTEETQCNVSQQGAVARLGVKTERFTFDLLGGYASGDGNPFDADITNFRFDRDFKAGLILFDQVVAWQSAGMVRRATDPSVTNVPAAGVELLSTSGAITNAIFAQPTVKFRATKNTQFTGSALWAVAPQRYVDAFWLNRASAKKNGFGQDAQTGYGIELDLGADYRRELSKGVSLLVGVQGGYFLPGDAFAIDAQGTRMDPVYLVKGRTGLVF